MSRIRFNGIVDCTAQVKALKHKPNGGAELVLYSEFDIDPDKVKLGDSISVNGICMSLQKYEGSCLYFDVWPITLQKTTISRWTEGTRVNLEYNKGRLP